MPDLQRLLAEREFQKVIDLVSASNEPSIMDIGYRGEAYFALKQWMCAAEDIRRVLISEGLLSRFTLYPMLKTALNKAKLKGTEKRVFWYSCSHSHALEAEKIADRLKQADWVGIEAQFAALCRDIFPEPDIHRAWEASFEMLIDALQGKAIQSRISAPARKKVIVSGMGWSGSGAIYDYLLEFGEVARGPFGGEHLIIESKTGFRGFIAAISSREACINHSVEFFFRNLLGYFPMYTGNCYNDIRLVKRQALDTTHGLRYAQSVQAVVHAMAELITIAGEEEKIVAPKLSALGNAIADNIVAFGVPENRVALLDNCVHIVNIALAGYLRNTHILCSVRDPRSNYVALKRESSGFAESVDEFIARQARIRSEIAEEVSAIVSTLKPENGVSVRLMQFEEFVLSPTFREEIAKSIGLDLQGQKKFTRFKPWESFRNTQLHHEYENSAEILQIYEELLEYCVEYSVRKVEEKCSSLSKHNSPLQEINLA